LSADPLVYQCSHCTVGVYHGDPFEPWDRLVRASRALRSHTITLAVHLRTYGELELEPWLVSFQQRLRADIEKALDELPGGPRFGEEALVRLAEERWGKRTI